ncbi:MAG: sporulation protein YqfD [Dysosmobacter sp.]
MWNGNPPPFLPAAWAGGTAGRCAQAVREMDCTVTVVGREGAPYFLLRFRRRYVLLAGLGLCAAAMVYGLLFHLGLSGGGQRDRAR